VLIKTFVLLDNASKSSLLTSTTSMAAIRERWLSQGKDMSLTRLDAIRVHLLELSCHLK
jgi:hypothetical protein